VVWLVAEAAVEDHGVAAHNLWPDTLVVADALWVESARVERLAALSGQPLPATFEGIHQRERLWFGLADVVVAPTSADQAALSDVLGDVPVELLQDPLTAGPPIEPADREGVLWWADFTQDHNIDAAHWLCREVLPRSQSGRRPTPAFLAGPGCSATLTSLAGHGVTITEGDNVEALLARARVAACPLRHGSGAALRAGRATAAGLTLVGTSLGVDAAGFTPGVGAWAADDADGLARAIAELHRDHEAWRAMSHAAQDQVGRRRTAITSSLLQLLRR